MSHFNITYISKRDKRSDKNQDAADVSHYCRSHYESAIIYASACQVLIWVALSRWSSTKAVTSCSHIIKNGQRCEEPL